jgi:transposase-like protein
LNSEEGTAVKKNYQVISRQDRRALAQWLTKNGQGLLPLVELVEGAEIALEELIDVTGRATIEAVLELSALQVAGEPQRGRRDGEVIWHGRQPGQVRLSDRKLKVQRIRLRRRGGGMGAEVPVPAYEALKAHDRSGARMLEILLSGVSTRNYAKVLPEMAESVGLSRSAVSREFVAASADELQALCERRLDGLEIIIIYIDGIRFAGHHVMVALGVDPKGKKHLLGVREGATENATVVTELLADLVARGLDPKQRRLFVIDGSKALRAAIERVFGERVPVQRCRTHKLRNVRDHLPPHLQAQVSSAMRAAFRLAPREGSAKLTQQASWLEREYPDAAGSLREGLEELFTINRLGLSPSLCRALGSTNIIENPNSTARRKTKRVTRWRDGEMVKRWAAAAFLDAEHSFRRILGYRDLWILKAILNENQVANEGKAA